MGTEGCFSGRRLIKNLSANNIPPFAKGGGFFQSHPKQIPLCPPFSKGDLSAVAYLRISSKKKSAYVGVKLKSQDFKSGWNL
jgi:hypothetical protein